MKKFLSLLTALVLCLCLTATLTDTAYAGDLDYIHRYDVTVTPNAEDGSLHIRLDFEWEVLDEGPVEWLQIGIPNGSIRDVEALTDNIASLDFDNSFMYVYFTRGYDDGEVFTFSYAWTQEYMYTLDGSGGVTYDYTPGWFDEARIGQMSLTWNTPNELWPVSFSTTTASGQWDSSGSDTTAWRYVGHDLDHGAQLPVAAKYASWPTELLWEGSSENLPENEYYYPDYDDDYYYDDTDDDLFAMLFFVIFMVVVISIIVSAASSANSYSGGFGTRYVLYHGLWYPAGRDGKPRPGSVGTVKKPAPPRRSSGGFGGGSRGGGFGGGGFGGGGHCACASSCACACACACAGGGRAGCSAKNLCGSVQLSRQLTEKLTKK